MNCSPAANWCWSTTKSMSAAAPFNSRRALPIRSTNCGPGNSVNVRLLLGEYTQALTVPAAVVQRSQSGPYAYVIGADGKAQLRPIEVLQIQDGKAVVAKGLQAGETVVLDGQYKITAGATVVANRAAAGTPAEAPAGKQ